MNYILVKQEKKRKENDGIIFTPTTCYFHFIIDQKD